MDQIAKLPGQLRGHRDPAITEFVVGKTGQFFWAFAVCPAAYAFLPGPAEAMDWSKPGRNRSARA